MTKLSKFFIKKLIFSLLYAKINYFIQINVKKWNKIRTILKKTTMLFNKYIISKIICFICFFFIQIKTIQADTIQTKQKVWHINQLKEIQKIDKNYIKTFYDVKDTFSIETILSPSIQKKFEYTNTIKPNVKSYWFKIIVNNPHNQGVFFINTHTWNSEVYLVKEDEPQNYQKLRNGISISKSKRDFLLLTNHLPINLSKGNTSIYLRMREMAVSTNTNYGKKNIIISHYSIKMYELLWQFVFDAFVFSILFVMTLYNFFIYLFTKDKTYFYYVFCTFFLLLHLFSSRFYIPLLFDLNIKQYYFLLSLSNFFILFCFILFISFSQSYVNTAQTRVVWHRIIDNLKKYTLIIVGSINVILLIYNVFYNIGINNVYIDYLIIFSNVIYGIDFFMLIVFCVYILKNKKSNTEIYYVYINFLLFLFGIIHVLSFGYLGILPDNIYFNNALKVGASLEVILFSIALASYINTLRKSITDKIIENQELEKEKIIKVKEIIEQKNIELEQKVKERTFDLQQSNEEIKAQADILQIQKNEIEQQSILLADEKNRQLMNITLQIIQKNEILPLMKNFLDNTKTNIEEEEQKKEAKKISKIIAQNTNIDAQWESMKIHFEQVHPNLFKSLNELCPTLTNHDLRQCAYLKMGLDKKEIAVLLNLDPESVRKHQYRIKKKLNLDEETSLPNFLKNIF
ncbi:MAG: hypothetical protein EAZ85_12885 [Bacteroidetes bacterium]|nr:MAG: hypothetical protein EAZ85_12885 [Bacteroidota bacterium]